MTAIEWLVEELNQKIHIIPMDKWDKIRDLVQKAKEMEKKQIINACNQTDFEDINGMGIHETITKGEQYYNETFKSE